MSFDDDNREELYADDYVRLDEEKLASYNYDRSDDPADQLAERVVVAVVRGAGSFPIMAGAVLGISEQVIELVEFELLKLRMELTSDDDDL